MSRDYQTRQLNTEEGDLNWPIRTRHNVHTHTGNTRQLEPQLKSSSCSSDIPRHNWRDVIPSHNSKNVTCLTPIPSHKSRNISKSTLETSLKLVDHAHSKQTKHPCFINIAWRYTPGAIGLQTAWQGTRTARHLYTYCSCNYRLAGLSMPPDASLHTNPLEQCLSPGGLNHVARRHTNTTIILVFLHFVQLQSSSHVLAHLQSIYHPSIQYSLVYILYSLAYTYLLTFIYLYFIDSSLRFDIAKWNNTISFLPLPSIN